MRRVPSRALGALGSATRRSAADTGLLRWRSSGVSIRALVCASVKSWLFARPLRVYACDHACFGRLRCCRGRSRYFRCTPDQSSFDRYLQFPLRFSLWFDLIASPSVLAGPHSAGAFLSPACMRSQVARPLGRAAVCQEQRRPLGLCLLWCNIIF